MWPSSCVNIAVHDACTRLLLSPSDGSYAIANWLLEQKAPVNAVDRFGMTPLESAVRGKHKELAVLLKSAGGKVMHNGFLVELEASSLSGVVPMHSDWSENMDWDIPAGEVHLVGILGEGAFGTVHRARWRGTTVAVKTLKRLQNATADKVALAEFRTELAMIQHLHHPHIVQFLGVMSSPEDGAPMLVTEYMEQGSLADWFRRPNPMSDLQALDMCLDCCRGMTYLHGRNPNPVLHRDLKPNNLMITRGGRLKIGDFGLSKTLSVRNRLPQDMSQAYKLTGETGSYRYMAPEGTRERCAPTHGCSTPAHPTPLSPPCQCSVTSTTARRWMYTPSAWLPSRCSTTASPLRACPPWTPPARPPSSAAARCWAATWTRPWRT